MKLTLTPKIETMTISDVPLQTIFSGSINDDENLVWVKVKRFGEDSFIMPLTGDRQTCTFGGSSSAVIENYTAYVLGVER
jgi:hypothetical protein